MGHINKFFRLSAADRRLFLRAFLLVCLVRLGLWILPFSVMRKFLVNSACSEPASAIEPGGFIDRVVWAVGVASDYVPAATCLTQAFVTRFLLVEQGCDAVVRIGVARSKTGRFQAHAWVESNGRVIIGGSETSLSHFTELRTSSGGGL
jgi:hypothetical protein